MEIKILGTEYTLPEGITVFGRGEDADIQIDSGKLSRMHSRFTLSGDTIEVEDLGSKNGTFVNGKRLEARKTLIKGDQLRLADLECTLTFPGGAASAVAKAEPAKADTPKPTAAPAAAAPAASRARKASGEKAMIMNMVKLGIAVVIAFAVYVFISGYESPELKKARALVTEAEVLVDEAEVADTVDANLNLLDEFGELKRRLGDIPADFEKEYRQAGDLIDEIDEFLSDLKVRNAEIEGGARIAQAIAEMDAAAKAYEDGQLDAGAALQKIESISGPLSNEAAIAHARQLVSRIKSKVLIEEEALVAETQTKAMNLARAGRYGEGLAAIAACVSRNFMMLPPEKTAELSQIKDKITKMAVSHFEKLAAQAVTDARTGDCAALKKKLADELAAMNVPGLDEYYDAAAAKIDGIRAERLAAARAKLAKELKVADDLERKRMYSQAAAKYVAIAAATTEDELKKEVLLKKSYAGLMAHAKKMVIDYINKQDGLVLEGVGTIQKASEISIDLVMGEVAMPVGWDKIRDNEFQLLLGKALAEVPDGEGQAAYGYLLVRQNNIEAAGVALAKAARMSPGLGDRYPDLFGPVMARLKKAKEEAAARLAASRAAQAAGSMPKVTSTVKPESVSTFHCISMYWSPAKGDPKRKVQVRYRPAGEKRWKQGLSMRMNKVPVKECRADYRGSIVNLKPGMTYDIDLLLEGTDERTVFRATTWKERFPIASTVKVKSQKGTYVVNRSGNAKGYVLFDGTGATIDGEMKANHGITVEGSYVILRGFTIKNSRLHGIRLMNVTDVVVEDCDISAWGVPDKTGFGDSPQAGIFSNFKEMTRIVVQRTKIHHPNTDSNSWAEMHTTYHPDGPQCIIFWQQDRGNHVFRYNEFYSDDKHMFNDIMGAGENASYRGFPGADTDIYCNFLSHCWDDGLELEGGNSNVRVWNNYIDETMMAIGNAAISIGPLYVWHNVTGRSYTLPGSQWGLTHGSLFKMGYAHGDKWMTGHQYIFSNTIFQKDNNGANGLGGGGKPIKHVMSRNNILHVRDEDRNSIAISATHEDNDFDYDLCSKRFPTGHEKHGKMGKPRYVSNAGFNYETRTGVFQLVPGSTGYDHGQRIPNFTDGFKGSAPDMGAHEGGTPPMVFGLKAVFIPPE